MLKTALEILIKKKTLFTQYVAIKKKKNVRNSHVVNWRG